MSNLISLGTAATNLAVKFLEFDNYRVYSIDDQKNEEVKDVLLLPSLETPEQYELLDLPKLKGFLQPIENSVLFIVSGASICSGFSLRVLEHIFKHRTKDIKILYIYPEIEFLSKIKILQEKVTRNVLQQYTRSGVFKNMVMISNVEVEKIIENCTILEYYSKINETIAYGYHMIEVFKNSKPVSSTRSKIDESSRISTIGMSSLEKTEVHLLFPIDNVREIVYYFGINEEKLKSEKNLFRKIMGSIKSLITEYTKVSFSIYSTKYDEDYVFVEYFSPRIQKNS